ncbi:MAG TPA: alpha/beta hydrolase [Mycobacteriales bacterium]|nr:alpha/beta hydrolase [Mycobacteriales bacterium]
MPLIDGAGVRLYAERQGEGLPLLFISGTGATLAAPPRGFDLSFASRFDMVCYDQRGLGRSDRPTSAQSWTMADYADDAACVLDWAGWETGAVVGVSFGGMVAQELLVRHPGRVDSAALVCTSSGGEGGASYPLHELTDLPIEDNLATYLPIMDTRWADPTTEDPLRDLLTQLLARRPAPDAGNRAQLEARRTHDTFGRLSSITTPVLVAAGRYDGIAPLSNSEAIASQIPGAILKVYDGGHGFLYQVPQSVTDVADFVTRVVHTGA